MSHGLSNTSNSGTDKIASQHKLIFWNKDKDMFKAIILFQICIVFLYIALQMFAQITQIPK